MKTHDPELLDQVLDAWKAIQISPIDPLALLHWPIDELTPEESILDLRVEVGRQGVTGSLVVLLLASLPVLLGVLPRIIRLGTSFQANWTNPFFLVLILIVMHFEFVEWGVLPLGPIRRTFAMSEGLFLLFPFKHGPFIVVNDARRSVPLGSPSVRCIPLLRWHHPLTRGLAATLLLSACSLLGGTPTRWAMT